MGKLSEDLKALTEIESLRRNLTYMEHHAYPQGWLDRARGRLRMLEAKVPRGALRAVRAALAGLSGGDDGEPSASLLQAIAEAKARPSEMKECESCHERVPCGAPGLVREHRAPCGAWCMGGGVGSRHKEPGDETLRPVIDRAHPNGCACVKGGDDA